MTTSGIRAAPRPFAGLPLKLQALMAAEIVFALAGLGVALATAPRLVLTTGLFILVPVLAVTIVIGDLLPVRIGSHEKASLGHIPALVAALLMVPWLAAVVAAAAALAGNLLAGRNARNSTFNAAQMLIAVLTAAVVAPPQLSWAPADAWRLVAALLAFSVLTVLPAALAAAFLTGHRLLPRLLESASANWAQSAATAAMAAGIAILWRTHDLAAVLPLALLPLIWRMNVALSGQLSANEQLQGVLAGQRKFLTDVSHNVGNPLATIQANLSLLRPLAGPRLRHSVDDAANEASRLAELFRRLRLLAETEEGVPLAIKRLDLAVVADELVRAYSAEADRRGVGLTWEATMPAEVDADVDLLRQAAANLVENALRLTPKGGAVKLVVGRDKREAVFDVVDDGPGIRADLLPFIFDRFKKGPQGGSGLGLAIARSVVERHGGAITVQSRPGAGARFQIHLPVAG